MLCFMDQKYHLPEYDKTYDLEAATRLDHQVMDAMKKA